MSDATEPDATAAPTTEGRKPRWGWRVLGALLALVLTLVAYLVFAPSPIDAVAYDPPPKPAMTGVLAPNDLLQAAVAIHPGELQGPEDLHIDSQGNLYAGTIDGRVVRMADFGRGPVETLAETGGRPLGIDMDAAGNLIVCDAIKGLLSIDPQGKLTVLATEAAGVPLGFADDVAVARDGAIYFSDASSKYGSQEYLFDMLEARPWGRLLKYDPATKLTTVLLDSLYFANGVALSQQEDFVLVNETYRYAIRRYWLKGPQVGTDDVFAENLPGFPDGVWSNGQGTFWVAMFTVRNDMADWLHRQAGLKNALVKLPSALWPQPERYGLVVALDEQGQLVRTLQDPTGEQVWQVTSVNERDGAIYLGTLTGDRINRVVLPK
ncbi:MAG: SMP-30/gluconolactonase/LRE family protein [Pirellulales bacterium]|nr:SMP-30/gluconolactonase/LRE family protein [Pirellulales bacterium]